MKVLLFIFLLFPVFSAVWQTAGCSSNSRNDELEALDSIVSEITLSNGGGQTNYWYRIVLKKDGTAGYAGDVSPERRGENKPFGQTIKENQRVKYRSKLSRAQFDTLVKLIMDNGFFSMNDASGVMDAPQTTTGAVRFAVRKEVRNQLGRGGEKLAEIEQAIGRAADQIKWEQE